MGSCCCWIKWTMNSRYNFFKLFGWISFFFLNNYEENKYLINATLNFLVIVILSYKHHIKSSFYIGVCYEKKNTNRDERLARIDYLIYCFIAFAASSTSFSNIPTLKYIHFPLLSESKMKVKVQPLASIRINISAFD